jgi:hypothetical protein
MKAKYGIIDDDIYNFDETGFMMGIICTGMVVETSDGRGKAKLAQPGNREWPLMRAFVILAKGTMAVMHQIILQGQRGNE